MKKRHTGLVILLAALFVAEAAALCLVYSGFLSLPGAEGHSPAAVQPQDGLVTSSAPAEATPKPTPEPTPEPTVETIRIYNYTNDITDEKNWPMLRLVSDAGYKTNGCSRRAG